MKKEKAAAQQMKQVPAQRYQADIANGLSQEQVQERIDGGWTKSSCIRTALTGIYGSMTIRTSRYTAPWKENASRQQKSWFRGEIPPPWIIATQAVIKDSKY